MAKWGSTTPIAYLPNERRVCFSDVVEDELVYCTERSLIVSEKLANTLPLKLPLSIRKYIFRFLYTPHRFRMLDTREIFWSVEQIEALNGCVLDTTLRPPLSIWRRYGYRSFMRGTFDNPFHKQAYFCIRDVEVTYKPDWCHPNLVFIPAIFSAIVPYSIFGAHAVSKNPSRTWKAEKVVT